LIHNETDPVLLAYVSHWDAMTAGVEDAEAATGASLFFGGTASGGAARDKYFLPSIFNHFSTGVNAYNGRAVRLDYITAHVKGGSTSYGTVVGEWGVSALIRSNPSWIAAGLHKLAVSNDEGDPMVGWEVAEDWRSDARYSSIIPKMIVQHLVTVGDNATNNPLGLLSFDGAFMNGAGDTYTGFGQRTMTARFGTPDSRGPFAFVKKSGLAAFTLLSRLGDQRCEYSGAPSGSAVLSSNAGVLATLLAPGADPVTGGQATVLVYNSADCNNDTAPALDVGVTLTGLPFTPCPADGSVVAVLFVLDQDVAHNPAATWGAMNSPATPSAAQLQALWSSAAAMTAAAAAPLPVAVGAQGTVTLPRTPLALPGIAMWHLAAKGASAPAPPPSLVAYAKAPNASFIVDATEVMLRWDCSTASRAVLAYTVQTSTAGPGGPWSVVNGAPYPQDISCSYVHLSPTPAAWYRVAAMDYWMRPGTASAAAAAGPWPTGRV
jgi:L-iduronidase